MVKLFQKHGLIVKPGMNAIVPFAPSQIMSNETVLGGWNTKENVTQLTSKGLKWFYCLVSQTT